MGNKTTKLLYEELSFKIHGLLFEVDNTIGSGQKEEVYSKGFEELLKREGIHYQRELYFPIKINDKIIAKRYFDFLIEDKIVLELKVANYQFRDSCTQLFQYLKTSHKKLGIIARFTKYGVRTKRILNIRDDIRKSA